MLGLREVHRNVVQALQRPCKITGQVTEVGRLSGSRASAAGSTESRRCRPAGRTLQAGASSWASKEGWIQTEQGEGRRPGNTPGRLGRQRSDGWEEIKSGESLQEPLKVGK